MFYCKNCGATLQEGDTFCGVCGQAVQVAAPIPTVELEEEKLPIEPTVKINPVAPSQPVAEAPVQLAPVAKAKSRGRGLGVCSLVLGNVSLVFGLFFAHLVLLYTIIFDALLLINKNTIVTIEGLNQFLNNETYHLLFIVAMIVCALIPLTSAILAVISKIRGYKSGVATAGLALSIIATLVYGVIIALLFV